MHYTVYYVLVPKDYLYVRDTIPSHMQSIYLVVERAFTNLLWSLRVCHCAFDCRTWFEARDLVEQRYSHGLMLHRESYHGGRDFDREAPTDGVKEQVRQAGTQSK